MFTFNCLPHVVLHCVTEVLMLDSFDHVFWFGDLNYRVDITRDQADQYLVSSDLTVSSAHLHVHASV